MDHISIFLVFGAGLFSFLNPCVLPLIPGFLGYLSGISAADSGSHQRKIFYNSVFFVLGFSCIFAFLGVLLNTVLRDVSFPVKTWSGRIAGVLIIIFGFRLLGLLKLGFLETEHKITLKTGLKPSYLLSFVFGAVFAVSWTPCVGAILGSVLALAISSPGSSFLLLVAYALGMGIPFLFVGLFTSLAAKVIQKSAGFLKFLNIIAGFLLVIVGVFVFTGNLSLMAAKGALKSESISIEKKEMSLSASRLKLKAKKYVKARELIFPDGYINTASFSLKDLIGKKVILLDFWTYSCINCQRTFPYLKAWYAKYKDAGFEIVGIHSPEFTFEQDYANVEAAVKKWGITYPVVLDNGHANLELYNTVYWPTEVLIDIDGFIVEKNIGEGGYEKTERKIQELLSERKSVLREEEGAILKGKISKPFGVTPVDFSQIQTPEIYLGAQMSRGNFGSSEGLSFGKVVEYKLPERLDPDEVYLEGAWHNGSDNLKLESQRGKIVLIYKARVVNLVAGALNGDVLLKIRVDGKLLTGENRGKDILPSGDLKVGPFDLYNIVSNTSYGRHTLEIEIEASGLAVYALTFG